MCVIDKWHKWQLACALATKNAFLTINMTITIIIIIIMVMLLMSLIEIVGKFKRSIIFYESTLKTVVECSSTRRFRRLLFLLINIVTIDISIIIITIAIIIIIIIVIISIISRRCRRCCCCSCCCCCCRRRRRRITSTGFNRERVIKLGQDSVEVRLARVVRHVWRGNEHTNTQPTNRTLRRLG